MNTLLQKYRVQQGRPQDLIGGPRIFFRFGNLHVAKRHAAHGFAIRLARGVRGHVPPRKFFKMVQFGAFWCIFGSDFYFKKFRKLPFFYRNFKNCNFLYKRINIFDTQNIILVKKKIEIFMIDAFWYLF